MESSGPIGRLAQAIGRAAAMLFVAAAAISVYEVAMRYGLGRPSAWAHVLVTSLCAIGFALGGAYAMARGEHVRITVVLDRLRGRARMGAEVLALLVGLFYLAGLGYGLWIVAEGAIMRFGPMGWTPERTPGPPNWPLPALFKGIFVLATALFALVAIERLVRLALGRGR